MKQFLIRLFRPKHYVAHLAQQSKDAFNTFNETIKTLTNVNKMIEMHRAEKVQVVNEAREAIANLDVQEATNTKMINKINSFIHE